MIRTILGFKTSRALLSLFMLATFVALLCIHAFTMHVHIDEYGHIVVHSHVMPAGKAATGNSEHSHSYMQMHSLEHGLNQLDGMICLGSFLLFFFLIILHLLSESRFSARHHLYHSLCLRGPPQFSL